MSTETRTCKTCGETKQRATGFYSAGRDCRACRKEAARRHYQANKEQYRQRALEWSRKNPEYYRQYNKTWYAENREARKEQIKAYWDARPDRRMELNRRKESARRSRMAGNRTVPFTEQQLEARLAVFGGRCWICRSAPGDEVDHVKPTVAGGPHMLANLRPACRSCNSSKGAAWPFDPAPYREVTYGRVQD